MTRRSAVCHNPPPAMSPRDRTVFKSPAPPAIPADGGISALRAFSLRSDPEVPIHPVGTGPERRRCRVEVPPIHGVARLAGGLHDGRWQRLEELLVALQRARQVQPRCCPTKGQHRAFLGPVPAQPASSGSSAGSASVTRRRSGVPATLGREVAGSCSPTRTRSRFGISSRCAPAP